MPVLCRVFSWPVIQKYGTVVSDALSEEAEATAGKALTSYEIASV